MVKNCSNFSDNNDSSDDDSYVLRCSCFQKLKSSDKPGIATTLSKESERLIGFEVLSTNQTTTRKVYLTKKRMEPTPSTSTNPPPPIRSENLVPRPHVAPTMQLSDLQQHAKKPPHSILKLAKDWITNVDVANAVLLLETARVEYPDHVNLRIYKASIQRQYCMFDAPSYDDDMTFLVNQKQIIIIYQCFLVLNI